jgi:hypothetical protein
MTTMPLDHSDDRRKLSARDVEQLRKLEALVKENEERKQWEAQLSDVPLVPVSETPPTNSSAEPLRPPRSPSGTTPTQRASTVKPQKSSLSSLAGYHPAMAEFILQGERNAEALAKLPPDVRAEILKDQSKQRELDRQEEHADRERKRADTLQGWKFTAWAMCGIFGAPLLMFIAYALWTGEGFDFTPGSTIPANNESGKHRQVRTKQELQDMAEEVLRQIRTQDSK